MRNEFDKEVNRRNRENKKNRDKQRRKARHEKCHRRRLRGQRRLFCNSDSGEGRRSAGAFD